MDFIKQTLQRECRERDHSGSQETYCFSVRLSEVLIDNLEAKTPSKRLVITIFLTLTKNTLAGQLYSFVKLFLCIFSSGSLSWENVLNFLMKRNKYICSLFLLLLAFQIYLRYNFWICSAILGHSVTLFIILFSQFQFGKRSS